MHYTDAPDAQNQLMNFIRLCDEHAIPCDSFQLSSGYTSINGKRYVFNWNYDKVPQPKVMSRAFHDAGCGLRPTSSRVCCRIIPATAKWRNAACSFVIQKPMRLNVPASGMTKDRISTSPTRRRCSGGRTA